VLFIINDIFPFNLRFIHNIAEGFCVAVPVLAGTGNRWLALGLTAASGLSEPLGAILGYVAVRLVNVGNFVPLDAIINASLCLVAGVMIFISFSELLPEANRASAGNTRFVIQAAIAGGIIIMSSLYFL
jgi:zinc transporter, ZIP family